MTEGGDKAKEDVLSEDLRPFGDHIKWTIRDACHGTQVFGGTGSGKTSGSGRALARAFLRHGFGGLVLTAKSDEVKDWREYIRDAKPKRPDPVVLEPGDGREFNFIDYERRRPGESGGSQGLTLDLVSLFLTTLSTGQSGSTSDAYWNDALRELLTHTIDLARFGEDSLDLAGLAEIIRSAPQTRQDVSSQTWQRESRCFQLIAKAATARSSLDVGRQLDLDDTVAYWLHEFPNLAEKTRSIIVSSFTSKLSGLLRAPLRQMFCSGISEELLPARTHEGGIIILNLPVKEYGEIGRLAQTIYKTVWQRSTERRKLVGEWAPVFLWADESQYFVTEDDMKFQQTARSRVAATVYLTQNLPNYYAAMPGRDPRSATDSLLGNLVTKIFHANSDPSTNEWAERLFASKEDHLAGLSTGAEHGSVTSQQTAFVPDVPARKFARLRRGGPPDNKAEAIIYLGGRKNPKANCAFDTPVIEAAT